MQSDPLVNVTRSVRPRPQAVGRTSQLAGNLAAILLLLWVTLSAAADDRRLQRLDQVLDAAERLTPLKAVVLAQHGEIVAERGYRGHTTHKPTNIKSASKSVMSALIGIAIERGVITGVDQPIAPLLAPDLPEQPDSRLASITIGHLLSMQAGLARTSGKNYGPWILTRNWVRSALAQPFVDEPGGAMLYSTGSTHLLSAILTRTTGRSTLDLAREWLAPLDDFHIQDWQQDPQGIYFGGNQMAMSTRSLLAFGELYRNCGRSRSGTQVLSSDWIERSWQPRTRSRFSGDGYGYGWFRTRIGGHEVAYAWGYGGQMLYVVPAIGSTVAMTSNDYAPAGRTGHRDDLHRLMAELIAALAPDHAASETAAPDVASPARQCGLDPAGRRKAGNDAAEPGTTAQLRPS
jgi:CubicO group peptidase (beta-lactamase class C family)